MHLLVVYPPKVAISSLVNSLKGVSSRLLRKKEYPSIKEQLWGEALWSPSYFAGSWAVLQLKLYASTLNSKIHRTKYHLCKHDCGVALYPPPEVGGFTATEDKDDRRLISLLNELG